MTYPDHSKRPAILALSALAMTFALTILGPRGSQDLLKDSYQPKADQYLQDLRNADLQNLHSKVAAQEAKFSDIVEGAAADIIWYQSKQQTQISLVYLHGFSASPQEIAPVPQNLARALKANYYAHRLAGHGRGTMPMGEASVSSWLADGHQAVEIGQKLGKRVWLVATSTGCTLASIIASRPDFRDRIAGMILVSPNFGARDPRGAMLSEPWAPVFIQAIVGDYYQFRTQNDHHARFWTSKYPSHTLLTMQALVELAKQSKLEDISCPTLIVSDPLDRVVSPIVGRSHVQRIGSATDFYPFFESADHSHHILAGQILSPSSNQILGDLALDFVQRHHAN